MARKPPPWAFRVAAALEVLRLRTRVAELERQLELERGVHRAEYGELLAEFRAVTTPVLAVRQ